MYDLGLLSSFETQAQVPDLGLFFAFQHVESAAYVNLLGLIICWPNTKRPILFPLLFQTIISHLSVAHVYISLETNITMDYYLMLCLGNIGKQNILGKRRSNRIIKTRLLFVI